MLFVNFLYYFLFICSMILVGIFSILTIFMGKKLQRKICAVWSSLIQQIMLKLYNFKIIDLNTQNIPNDEGFIIASKHQSSIETLYLSSRFSTSAFIYKKELEYIPFFGFTLSKSGMISIDRSLGSKALVDMTNKALNVLNNENRSIIIFPEGTRTKYGERGKYYSGVYMIYKKSNKKVLCVGTNSGKFLPKGGILPSKGSVYFNYVKVIEPGLKKDEFMKQMGDAIEYGCDEILAIEK